MTSDAEHLLDTALGLVRNRYEQDASQTAPVVFACRNNVIESIIQLDFDDPFTKEMSISAVELFLQAHNCDASIFLSEAWMSVLKDNPDGSHVRPVDSPDRVEVLICEVSMPGRHLSSIQEMMREGDKFVGFEERQRYDSKDVSDMALSSKFDFFGALRRRLDS